MPQRTPAERLDRINAIFGDGITTKSGGKISSHDSPLLFGVMTRALHRQSHGLQLSSLEERLAGTWRALINDTSELAEHSKLFTQSNVISSSPDIITNLPLEKSYSWDDLSQDLEQAQDPKLLVSSAMAAQVIDLATAEQPTSGIFGGVDSHTTFFTHSTIDTSAPVAPTFANYNLYLEQFRCVRKGDDSIVNEDNEVYWCFACTGDTGAQQYVTSTYGGVVRDSVRWFDKDGGAFERPEDPVGHYPLLYTGPCEDDTYVTAHIECWEEDDGGSQWKNKLQDFMLDLSKVLIDSANESRATAGRKGGRGVDYTLVVAAVSAAIAGLIEAFKNPDDCVVKRTIVLDPAALFSLYHQPEHKDEWDFNGGSEGHHKLTLRLY